jgi:hypothetical protein
MHSQLKINTESVGSMRHSHLTRSGELEFAAIENEQATTSSSQCQEATPCRTNFNFLRTLCGTARRRYQTVTITDTGADRSHGDW